MMRFDRIFLLLSCSALLPFSAFGADQSDANDPDTHTYAQIQWAWTEKIIRQRFVTAFQFGLTFGCVGAGVAAGLGALTAFTATKIYTAFAKSDPPKNNTKYGATFGAAMGGALGTYAGIELAFSSKTDDNICDTVNAYYARKTLERLQEHLKMKIACSDAQRRPHATAYTYGLLNRLEKTSPFGYSQDYHIYGFQHGIPEYKIAEDPMLQRIIEQDNEQLELLPHAAHGYKQAEIMLNNGRCAALWNTFFRKQESAATDVINFYHPRPRFARVESREDQDVITGTRKLYRREPFVYREQPLLSAEEMMRHFHEYQTNHTPLPAAMHGYCQGYIDRLPEETYEAIDEAMSIMDIKEPILFFRTKCNSHANSHVFNRIGIHTKNILHHLPEYKENIQHLKLSERYEQNLFRTLFHELCHINSVHTHVRRSYAYRKLSGKDQRDIRLAQEMEAMLGADFFLRQKYSRFLPENFKNDEEHPTNDEYRKYKRRLIDHLRDNPQATYTVVRQLSSEYLEERVGSNRLNRIFRIYR